MQPLFSLIAVTSACVSLLGKFLADRFLEGTISIVGSFFGLKFSENPGVAFGIRLPEQIQMGAIIIAFCIVFFLAIRTVRTRLAAVGFGLLLGGAAANILDRFLDGVVTDFISVGTFPVFNIADSCITVGVSVLLLEVFFVRRDREKTAA